MPRLRPLGVAVIALFLVADALLSVAELLGLAPAFMARLPLSGVAAGAPSLLLVVAALEIAAAIGLWRGSRRAWVLAMLLVGMSLVGDLYLYFTETPRYGRLVVDVIIAFYLNQGLVRDYFERHEADLGVRPQA